MLKTKIWNGLVWFVNQKEISPVSASRDSVETVSHILLDSRPGKSVSCSSDPESGFLTVPQFYFQNWLNILRINVPKEST